MHDPDVTLILSNIKLLSSNINQLREDMNTRLGSLEKKFTTHEEKDVEYWKKFDKRDTQLILLKGLTFSSFGLWFITWFAEQFGIKVGR